MIRVAVFGASGRMGATVCAAVSDADEMQLVAAIDPGAAGRPLGEVCAEAGAPVRGQPAFIEVTADAASLAADRIDVAVDFTVADAARENLAWCAAHGVHAVCGTTGLSTSDLERFAGSFDAEGSPNCVVAANFSIGGVLMMRCAELCAPYFEGVEVIELHHDRKKDAPSGTSLETVRRMEAARAQHPDAGPFGRDPTESFALEGARGGVTAGGVHVHSVRLPGLVAHQEVMFGSFGELLTIRHDSTDRRSFMPGVLLAIRRVGELPGLTVGLEPLLGL